MEKSLQVNDDPSSMSPRPAMDFIRVQLTPTPTLLHLRDFASQRFTSETSRFIRAD